MLSTQSHPISFGLDNPLLQLQRYQNFLKKDLSLEERNRSSHLFNFSGWHICQSLLWSRWPPWTQSLAEYFQDLMRSCYVVLLKIGAISHLISGVKLDESICKMKTRFSSSHSEWSYYFYLSALKKNRDDFELLIVWMNLPTPKRMRNCWNCFIDFSLKI